MAFEKFTEVGKSFLPRATITARGLLGFTEGACRRYGIDSDTLAVMYFDRETNRIAIELTKQEQPGSTKVRHRTSGADLSIKSFLAYYQIDVSRTTMFDIVVEPTTGWLIIDLNNGRERKSSAASEEVGTLDEED
ncbi:MAG: hypothetical protein JST51_10275 [Armatimonadetes bacterium]|nr:hypothetical protein [Armatimonadota bacterium]